jgi:hypothetical protein
MRRRPKTLKSIKTKTLKMVNIDKELTRKMHRH